MLCLLLLHIKFYLNDVNAKDGIFKHLKSRMNLENIILERKMLDSSLDVDIVTARAVAQLMSC